MDAIYRVSVTFYIGKHCLTSKYDIFEFEQVWVNKHFLANMSKIIGKISIWMLFTESALLFT